MGLGFPWHVQVLMKRGTTALYSQGCYADIGILQTLAPETAVSFLLCSGRCGWGRDSGSTSAQACRGAGWQTAAPPHFAAARTRLWRCCAGSANSISMPSSMLRAAGGGVRDHGIGI